MRKTDDAVIFDVMVAQILISEVGLDVSRWENRSRLFLMAGIVPG
jgi:hypothetical protein